MTPIVTDHNPAVYSVGTGQLLLVDPAAENSDVSARLSGQEGDLGVLGESLEEILE